MRSKYFVFTLNNYTEEDEQRLQALPDNGTCSYIVYGREVGNNGTPHLQGYAEFRVRYRLNQAKRYLGDRAHLELRRGTPEQARAYCVKDGSFWENGNISRVSRGTRTDLAAVQSDLDRGDNIRTIAENHFASFCRYGRAFREYRRCIQARRTWATQVIVLWGEPGTGKTRTAYWFDENLYSHPGGQWFDGYDGQRTVLFDDFTGSCFRLQYLLKLLDRYPMDVPVKGGFVGWVPRFIYITSNLSPEQWYPNAREVHVRALRRRFSRVVHYINF